MTIRAIVFDWGNTLMRVFPESHGPMAYWPRVEAMPGVIPALVELRSIYPLYLATNASDSDANLVRFALRRLGLEDFFVDIFTSKELQARKPNPLFYQSVLHVCGFIADEVVVMRDGYHADVLGARQAGLHAIWYNHALLPSPIDPPMHDVEIQAMSDLPAVLIELLKENQVPDIES